MVIDAARPANLECAQSAVAALALPSGRAVHLADLAVRHTIGIENAALHPDRIIDWNIVHTIGQGRLQDFEHFAAAILRALDQSQHGEQAS